jgi:hypothetical protein
MSSAMQQTQPPPTGMTSTTASSTPKMRSTATVQPSTTCANGTLPPRASSFAAALRNLAAKNAEDTSAAAAAGEKKRSKKGQQQQLHPAPPPTAGVGVIPFGATQPPTQSSVAPIGTIAPTMMCGAQATLLDVRKVIRWFESRHARMWLILHPSVWGTRCFTYLGPWKVSEILSKVSAGGYENILTNTFFFQGFDRSSSSDVNSTTATLTTTTSSEQLISSHFIGSGFQPYKPEASPPVGVKKPPLPPPFGASVVQQQQQQQHQPSAMHHHLHNPQYAAAAAALQAAYHAALYGAQPQMAYDPETLYRLQLERYAAVTGLAIGNPSQLGPFGGAMPTAPYQCPPMEDEKGVKASEEKKKAGRLGNSSPAAARPASSSSKSKSSKSKISIPAAAAKSSPSFPLQDFLPHFPPGAAAAHNPFLSHPLLPHLSLSDPSATAKKVDLSEQQMIRLPTKPLDISEVTRTTSAATSESLTNFNQLKLKPPQPPPNSKRMFVRPFEDDFKTESPGGKENSNVVKVMPFNNKSGNQILESNNNEVKAVVQKQEPAAAAAASKKTSEVKEQFAVLRSLMTAPPISARLGEAAAVVGRDSSPSAPLSTSQPYSAASWTTSPENEEKEHVFKEPVTKEKLKYLRYFRLVTHRKKNGMS